MATKIVREKKTGKLLMSTELSTGYKVYVDLAEPDKGIAHLAQALLGEVFLKQAGLMTKGGKKMDWKPALAKIHDEIANIVGHLSGADKSSLIHAVIWERFCSVTGNISARVNKKKRTAK